MKLFTLTMLAIIFSAATSFATITPMSPSSGTVCAPYSIYLADSLSPGGTWSSSNVAIATVGTTAFGAILTGVSGGSVTITYTTSGGTTYGTFTVNPAPAPIGGPTSYGVGCSVTLTDASAGGSWSTSSYSGTATIGASTGVATGVSAGTVWIYYTLAGCQVQTMDTVTGVGGYPIEGPTVVCVGSTIDLTDSTGAGGTWSSSTTAVAIVNPTTGVVTGVSAGTTTISLAFGGSCGTVYSTYVITVTAGSVGPVSGPATITVGGTGAYVASPSGGTWSISPTTVATIDASGNVTGVSAGTATVTYTATSCGTAMSATMVVTVTALDGISGNVVFSSAYYGMVKVWLIHYDPSATSLSALDSVTLYCSGTSVYYQFTGLTTDSFRVKAATDSFSTTGFIPTYHLNNYYWHDASVIYYTTGTSDIHEDIDMLTGTTTTGPGFISGNVLTGANRGTSSSIPAVGLSIVAMNGTTVAQMTTTDASGNYSFSNLPYGTYIVFPDSLNYLTTPYSSITLSSSSASFTGAGFIQHTLSKTITPILEAVTNATTGISSVSAFPNPTSGKLNIMWNEKTAETAAILITDITGREVYNATINMNEGHGMAAIDLSGITNGLYMMNIKSASLNYNNKIEVLH